jgi:hypothetical protein
MQIEEDTFNDICKNEFESFTNIKGVSNAENNIMCGIKILKTKFDEYKNGVKNSWSYNNVPNFVSIVDSCIDLYPKYETYEQNEAMLRAYNGWGCGTGSDINYVEKVVEIFRNIRA